MLKLYFPSSIYGLPAPSNISDMRGRLRHKYYAKFTYRLFAWLAQTMWPETVISIHSSPWL